MEHIPPVNCTIEVISFWKLLTTEDRYNLLTITKNQLLVSLKNRYKRRCTCPDCIRRKIPYFDDHAKLFDQIVADLQEKTEKSHELCKEAKFIFPQDVLFIYNGLIRFQKEYLSQDNLLETLEQRVRELQDSCNSTNKKGYCEHCHAVQEFQRYICEIIFYIIQKNIDYHQAKIRAEDAVKQLLKEAELDGHSKKNCSSVSKHKKCKYKAKVQSNIQAKKKEEKKQIESQILLPTTRELARDEEWNGIEVKFKSKRNRAKIREEALLSVATSIPKAQNASPICKLESEQAVAFSKEIECKEVLHVTRYYTNCFALPRICSLNELN